MLFKRRDFACLPDGLMDASVELVRGMVVARKYSATKGEYEVVMPTTAGATLYGFVTAREDEALYSLAQNDKIEAGRKCVVYTLVKDNEWATDQYTGALAVTDLVKAGADGKLVKTTVAEEAFAEVVGVTSAGAGYENSLVTVKVL